MSESSHFIDHEKVKSIELMPGVTTRVLSGLSGEKMMMVLTTVGCGVTVPAHRHPHEQLGMVYAGKASLRIGDEERIVSGRDIYFIPAYVEHEATAVGDESFIAFEVFCPVREDFVEKATRE